MIVSFQLKALKKITGKLLTELRWGSDATRTVCNSLLLIEFGRKVNEKSGAIYR
jgi:hypothetical protein